MKKTVFFILLLCLFCFKSYSYLKTPSDFKKWSFYGSVGLGGDLTASASHTNVIHFMMLAHKIPPMFVVPVFYGFNTFSVNREVANFMELGISNTLLRSNGFYKDVTPYAYDSSFVYPSRGAIYDNYVKLWSNMTCIRIAAHLAKTSNWFDPYIGVSGGIQFTGAKVGFSNYGGLSKKGVYIPMPKLPNIFIGTRFLVAKHVGFFLEASGGLIISYYLQAGLSLRI